MFELKQLELNKELNQRLEIVVEELNQIKQERQEKEIRKQARANRKRQLRAYFWKYDRIRF